MAKILDSRKHGAASEAQISNLEATIGFPLPEDYKEFLRRHNGGRPEPAAFHFKNDSGDDEENAVECFFPLRDLDSSAMKDATVDDLPDWPVHCAWEDLQRDLRTLYEDELEHAILPIATDGSGNYIAVVLEGDEAGSIVFFEHEMGTVTPLAANLTSFLDGLW